jgi:pimeloyl-ACP methyl ester carboxylesterase
MTRGHAHLPDGGWLYYEISGEPRGGAPLLLIRPLGGAVALWGTFRDLLAQDLRVVAFDPRGAGRSSGPPLVTTTRTMARDAVALLDHLALETAHVFGLSLGGMVAQWLALDAPGRLASLVLASTVPRGLDVSWSGTVRGLSLARCLLRLPREAQVCLVRRVLSDAFRREHPDQVREIEVKVRAQPASHRGLLALVGALATHDTGAWLHRIRTPTLVLAGAREQLLRHEALQDLARAIPGAAFSVIPDSGHALDLEAPAATAARIRSFVGR